MTALLNSSQTTCALTLLVCGVLATPACVFDSRGVTGDLTDSGGVDAGSVDAGSADAGSADAEPPAPTCSDGVTNGDETDVDCGGSCPAGCDIGQGCEGPADCVSDHCELTVCALPPCANGVQNGDELDVDCGGSCPDPCARIFLPDAQTLVALELNGDATDSLGSGRDAVELGGTYVPTAWGQGLSLPGTDPQGLDWSSYASLLTHPYTVELVLVPVETNCYQKLFSFADGSDAGWYYCNGFQAFPNAAIGAVYPVDERHYLALVSTGADTVDLYFNGVLVANTAASFTAPPAEAIFFRDDSATSRGETLTAVVDGLRISNVARTPAEITAQQQRLEQQPYVP